MLVAWNVPYETIQIIYCLNVDFKHLLPDRNILPDIIEFRVYLSNDAKIGKQNTEWVIL